MAKDKTVELKYKIEGLKRMVKRKVKRARKQGIKALNDEKARHFDDFFS